MVDTNRFWVRKSLLPAFCAVCWGRCRWSHAFDVPDVNLNIQRTILQSLILLNLRVAVAAWSPGIMDLLLSDGAEILNAGW